MVQVEVLAGDNSAKSLFRLKVFNYGKSPAHVIACHGPKAEYRSPDEELPTPPNYGTWEWDKQFLAPRDSLPLRDPINPWELKMKSIGETIDAEDRAPKPGQILVIYGLLQYTDGVSERPYQTAFCYRLKRGLLSDMGGKLIRYGPRVYNEYT
jgi:hypothetical protein